MKNKKLLNYFNEEIMPAIEQISFTQEDYDQVWNESNKEDGEENQMEDSEDEDNPTPNKNDSKWGRWITLVILILVLLAGGFSFYNHSTLSNSNERAAANLKYSQAWRSIATNIDSILPLSNVVTQEYSDKTGDISVERKFIELNSAIKDTNDKQEKYSSYKELVKLMNEIEANKDERVKDNIIIHSGITNFNIFSDTIDKLVKKYNSGIDKYNSTFDGLFNKEDKDSGLVKQKKLS